MFITSKPCYVNLYVCDTGEDFVLNTNTSYLHLKGEDGFPGFKGDMGLKGDKVNHHF